MTECEEGDVDEEFEKKVLAAVNDLRAFGHHWVREPDDALFEVAAERLSGELSVGCVQTLGMNMSFTT